MPQAAIPWIVGIGTAAKVGTDIYSAKKASDASKEAAQAQTAAGNQSLALQRDVWQQSQQNLQPWMQRGSQAVNTMAELMGFGPAPTAGAPPATTTPVAPTAAPRSAWEMMTPEERAYVRSGTTQRNLKEYLRTGNEAYDPSTHGLFAPEPGQRPVNLGSVMAGQAPVHNQSGYTQMQAPDGTVQAVPAQYVDHYTRLGARVVS